jgi:hypothetical protein
LANPGGNGQPGIDRAEHIGPSSGENIQAKRAANYVWNSSTLLWERMTQPGGGSGGDGHVTLAGSEVSQKDDTFYGEGVTTGIAATAKRNWNGTSYDRDWGQTQTKAYSVSAVSDDGTYKYFFFEDASLNYYIMRKHKANKVFTYTKGTGGYSAVYQSAILGPSGSPTFASYGNTF